MFSTPEIQMSGVLAKLMRAGLYSVAMAFLSLQQIADLVLRMRLILCEKCSILDRGLAGCRVRARLLANPARLRLYRLIFLGFRRR
jgi:hypothetical protein